MAENRGKLLLAGFLAIATAGMGFGVRGALLQPWSEQYGFTFTELGEITGGGLLGFGLVILIAGFLLDALGYRLLMILAVACQVVSAVMLFFATPVFESAGKDATYQVLFWSAFIFAVGNGIAEAVINPLTSAIYPERKTHYLNILHAGWPGGLVLGGLIGLLVGSIQWEILLALYLIPAVIYGYIALVERFPQTAAQQGTISYAGMLRDCLVPFFFFMIVVQAMVGYVELGTDSWIAKITGSILDDPKKGIMLFIYTSCLMFVLRFFAGPIVHRISSLGLLFVSACIGTLGLYLISDAEGILLMVIAVTVYAVGKTFLWPTMLGVIGEQFPRSATLAMALIGCAGMTSAGLLGGPGIGYKQDRFASQELEETSTQAFLRYQAEGKQGFLFFKPIQGLDGQKVGVIADQGARLEHDKQIAIEQGEWDTDKFAQLRSLDAWWQDAKQYSDQDGPAVAEAGLMGSRMAIRFTALIPAAMAVCYLLMILGFKAKGGYKHAAEEE
ncbi:MFS transporter [Bythopirellula goksoeyrii]|uniref:Major Facilitator Superfamily protein n=1 Tax=Bythopirellula goksoeyrii TaxID=1400387 RepID=A0A5B9QMJ9_9BACT|nr:MFS transporter [Bythopirellula goksoeyrii]QEG35351.1 Major Facilitator Superfamily protein [Bythopirellula goksoeyrii]